MNNTRHGLRAGCNDRCVFIHNGSLVDCTLKNISISGALVQVDEDLGDFEPGRRCGLHLCHDPQKCPGEYACQIIRVNSTEIGLKFMNMH
jgi:hypothetical protein